MTPIRSALLVACAIGAMLAVAGVGPVNDFLMERLGPKCKIACTYPRTDPLRWELKCQDCCDELRRGSACYADCSRGRLPDVCKKKTGPDTGCKDR